MRLALMLLILGFVVSGPAHAQVYTVLRGPQCPGPVEPFTQQIWPALEQPGRTSGYYCPEPAGPPERPVDPRKYANIRTVAVLSGIGSVVTINKRRAIGSVAKDMDVSDWSIDEFVRSRVREYLSSRFSFIDVTYDPRAMARSLNSLPRNSNPAIKQFFSTIRKDGIDAYVLIRRDATFRGPAGLGIDDPYRGENPVEFANYAIDIVDPRTLNVVATQFSRITLREGGQAFWTELLADADLKVSPDVTITDDQRAKFRSDFERLISISLPETLRAFQLGAALPPVTAMRSIVPMTPDQDPFPNIRSVGIVSVIADHFHLQRIAGFILSNRSAALPIADWAIDAHIEDTARKLLADRFVIKDVTVDREALMRMRLVDDFGKFATKFDALKATTEVDAYVVFLKFAAETGLGNYFGMGVGLLNHDDFGSFPKENALFAYYAIIVVDARTLEPIKAFRGATGAGQARPNPTRELDWSLWPDRLDSPSSDQQEAFKQGLKTLLSESVEETLLRMGLTANILQRPRGVKPTALH